jgi:Tfp pilus assembly protein FimT
MTVVAIISILSTIGIISYRNLLQKEYLKSGTQSMAAWLDGIRRLAIQQSETCAVQVSGSTATLRLVAYPDQTQPCGGSSRSFNLKREAGTESITLCATLQGPSSPAPACNTGSGNLTILFTPRGTSASPDPSNPSLTGTLLQTRIAGVTPNRCVQVIAPLGLLRLGRILENSCNWNKAV